MKQGILVVDHEDCIECGACIGQCPESALSLDDRSVNVRTGQGQGAATVPNDDSLR